MYTAGNISKSTWPCPCGRKGERLSPITIRRQTAVPFAQYKIIDFVLSNLFNSGIRKAYILTQYQATPQQAHQGILAKWTGLGDSMTPYRPKPAA